MGAVPGGGGVPWRLLGWGGVPWWLGAFGGMPRRLGALEGVPWRLCALKREPSWLEGLEAGAWLLLRAGSRGAWAGSSALACRYICTAGRSGCTQVRMGS